MKILDILIEDLEEKHIAAGEFSDIFETKVTDDVHIVWCMICDRSIVKTSWGIIKGIRSNARRKIRRHRMES